MAHRTDIARLWGVNASLCEVTS
ncbi:uncharacterized protein METZ01_LOCUS370589 [marine metagenome]|uniref:Uncharacterized protein n=1 Tax=marine metagenome TaxID=408172 RepID=A0A382T7J0_9ZZZZ